MQRALGSVLEAEGFGNDLRQVARKLPLQKRRACDYRNVEIARQFHQSAPAFPQNLISQGEGFGHPQIEGELHEPEVMHPAGNFLCRLRDVGKLHRIFRAWISPEPIPCGHAVVSNFPSCHGGF